MSKKSPPLPPSPKEGGHDYRLGVSQGDKGGDRFWGQEMIKSSKKLSFECDIRVQEFQGDHSPSEGRRIVISPDRKERATDPPLEDPGSSLGIEYKRRKSHAKSTKNSRSSKSKKTEKKNNRTNQMISKKLSVAERTRNITSGSPGESTRTATAELRRPHYFAAKGPPPGQPVSDPTRYITDPKVTPLCRAEGKGCSKKPRKSKKKPTSLSQHYGNASRTSPTGQAQADTGAAGSTSGVGAHATFPVVSGSWSPLLLPRKKKKQKRKKRRHSSSPSPTGQGEVEWMRETQLQQYSRVKAAERRGNRTAKEMKKEYEKEKKEQLLKPMLERQATRHKYKQPPLKTERVVMGGKFQKLEKLHDAQDLGQNVPLIKMSKEQLEVLPQHTTKIEELETERTNPNETLKQAQAIETHLQLQLDKVHRERDEVLNCIKERTDTYKHFHIQDHQNAFQTKLQRPQENLQRNRSRPRRQVLVNPGRAPQKPVTALFAPPELETVRDAKNTSLPTKIASTDKTIILGEGNPIWPDRIGYGRRGAVQETYADSSISPEPQRSLTKAPSTILVLDSDGSKETNTNNNRFIRNTPIIHNRGMLLSVQKTPSREKPPEDVMNLLGTALEKKIDKTCKKVRSSRQLDDFSRCLSRAVSKDQLSADSLTQIPPSQLSEVPRSDTVVESVQQCLQGMQHVVRTAESSTETESVHLRSLPLPEDRNTVVGDPNDRLHGEGLSSAYRLIESIIECVGNAMNTNLSNMKAFSLATGNLVMPDFEYAENEKKKKKKFRKQKENQKKSTKGKNQSGEMEWQMKKSKGKNNTVENKTKYYKNDRKQKRENNAEMGERDCSFKPASIYKISKKQSGKAEWEMKKSNGKKNTFQNKNKSNKKDRKQKKETNGKSRPRNSNFSPASISRPHTPTEDLYGEQLGPPCRQWPYSSPSDAFCSKCRETKRHSSCCSIHHGNPKRPLMIETSVTREGPHKQHHWLDTCDGRPGGRALTDNRGQSASSTSLRSQRLVRPGNSYENITPDPPCHISSYGRPGMYTWPGVTCEPREALPFMSTSMDFAVIKPLDRTQRPAPALVPQISLGHQPQIDARLILQSSQSSPASQHQTTSKISPLYSASAPQLCTYQVHAQPPRTTAVRTGSQNQTTTVPSLVPSTPSGATSEYFDGTLSRNLFILPYSVLTRQVSHKNICLTVFLLVGIVVCVTTLFGPRYQSHPASRKRIPLEEQGTIMQGPWLFNMSNVNSPLVTHAYKVCRAPDCKQEANRLTRVLASGPCKNFYDFVCSRRWASDARNADDAAIQEIQDGIWKHIEKAENSSCVAVAIWEACMDTHAIGSQGAAPFRDVLNASGLGGWPFFIAPLELDPWCVAGNLVRLVDLATLFSVSIEHSASQSLLIRLGNGKTLLSLRDFGNNVTITAFLGRVEQGINFLTPEVNDSSILAAEVLNVTRQLINLHTPNNNTSTFKFGITIKHFLHAALKNIINLSKQSVRITFDSPKYAKDLEQTIMVIAPRTALNYLGFYLVQHLWTFSPHDAAETVPYGWRERQCLRMAERAVPSQVLQIGLRVYEKRLNFTHFSVLSNETKRRLIRSIKFFPWMDYELKAALIEKVKRLGVEFIFPNQDHSHCSTPSEDSPPHLKPSSALTVYQRAVEQRFASTILRITGGGDAEQPRSVFSTQIEIDAAGNLYVPLAAAASSVSRQRVMSPYVAVMLETGFIVRFAKALLQATLGLIDNYQTASTPSAHAHYHRVQACFQKHFPALRDPLTGVVVQKPTTAVEGDVLEHVAVALAHLEFRRAVTFLQGNFSDYRLAGAEHLSAEQLFFVSYADSACQAYDDEHDFRFFLSRGESPARQRVNVVLSYDATFHRAFRCRRGHAMVPSRNCSFW